MTGHAPFAVLGYLCLGFIIAVVIGAICGIALAVL